MDSSSRFSRAIELFDKANSSDPNKESLNGREIAKELLYAQRMSDRLSKFDPDAGESLRLAVRCQHICRWEIPRGDYDMNRAGYLKWRNDLKKYHAGKAEALLKEAGYDEEMIAQVRDLLLKKHLKKNRSTQTLEDVVCLVFLEHYFEGFSKKYHEEKLLDICLLYTSPSPRDA